MSTSSMTGTLVGGRPGAPPGKGLRVVTRVVRTGLGAFFVYMGMAKALDPVGFLKLIRQYGIVEGPPALNLLAATLPWFEAFCGALWVVGLAVRGTALVLGGLLITLTAVVLNHALALHAAGNLPFCAIRFDCGCGAGEVLICRKLLENSLLILAVGWILWRGRR